ncbi:NAD-dependent epimerase/dehydratase family protein [Clostridium manihotivorum]|uniref:NAD(P)-dependent oxidoreductase n=1 Tax=Clostridium manihotivorum TaxID=2320868 RepID=A0A410DNC4_9CLOT|nr:NAD(P)-dependent oxidoreductase [Clostridium manihotivorum]QAA30591.1 NAD(P)-dependent oxidoreductase [Clostridium manihotivorum]
METNPKLLITGGTGFIGSNLINLTNSIYEITNLGRSKNSLCSNIYWDLKTPLDYIPLNNIDTVIHCAAIVNNQTFDNSDYIDINVKSTIMLLDFCIKNSIPRFILLSSGGVYGFRETPVSEDDLCKPQGMYQISKYFSEKICELYKDKLSITILRLFFPYGQGQSNRLISNLFSNIINHKTVTLNKAGSPKINPIYIYDVINILKLAINLDISGTFNVCGDEIVSIESLCQKIAMICGEKNLSLCFKEFYENDLIGNNLKLKNSFNYKPEFNLNYGLTSYFNWMKDNLFFT